MDTDDEIINIINNIKLILIKNDEKQWAIKFSELLLEYQLSSSKKNVGEKIISVYKGGMGSFSDLVLHKNGMMVINENKKLAELRKKLYQLCKKILES